MVKGLKSTWRMAPLILRTTLAGALTRILMHDDVQARALAPPPPPPTPHLIKCMPARPPAGAGRKGRLTGAQVAAACLLPPFMRRAAVTLCTAHEHAMHRPRSPTAASGLRARRVQWRGWRGRCAVC